MSIGIGIIIFFLSFIALVAEFFVYMMLGVGLSFADATANIGGLAWFFVGLMILTGTTGILAPMSAIIQKITKRKGIANKILLIGVGVIMVGYVLLTALGEEKPKGVETPTINPPAEEQKEEVPEIKAVLLNKGFREADLMEGIYEDYITFQVEFMNITDKNIRGFKGTFIFYDIFGDKIRNITISYDKGIEAEETKIWNGVVSYNQFIDSHKKLKNTDLENLKYEWEIEQIIYE